MSNKVSTFTQIITNPLNTHNFRVTIPSLQYDILVHSTSFPAERLGMVTLYTFGEPVRYPTIPGSSGNPGAWQVQMYENENGMVYQDFVTLKGKTYNQKTGLLVPQIWDTVEVHARDLADNIVFSSRMHGVWYQGRNEVTLDNSNPATNWDWNGQFVYQWIEDIK